jgi:TatD DNase family protein
MRLFDAHCHLHFPQFDADRAEVIGRMREAQVGAILVGTNLESSRAAVELARSHDFLWASVGLHPNDAQEWLDISSQVEELAKSPKVVAVGECGLDYFRSSGEGQQEKFEKQIALAHTLNKALIVHCRSSAAKTVEGRDAHDDCIHILQNYGIKVPVVMHFFTGTKELAQKYLDLGCYLSFPGPITYTDMYDESIRATPLDKILVETDAPYAAPTPHRGQRNEPVYVAEVMAKVALLKDIPDEELTEAMVKNARRIFRLQ